MSNEQAGKQLDNDIALLRDSDNDLWAALAAIDVRVGNLEQPTPTPEPTPPPPPEVPWSWSLKADPDVLVPPEWEPYLSRVVAAAGSNLLYPDPFQYARAGNLYGIGRFGREYVTALTACLRATGQPVFVGLIASWLDALRTGLNADGMFLWLQDPNNPKYYNKPWHEMDTMLSWGAISLAAEVMYHNPQYMDRHDYWANVLAQQEVAWVTNRGGPPSHSLAHPVVGMAQYYHHTARPLERDSLLNAFRASINDSPLWWPHNVITGSSPQTGAYYPSLTATSLLDLWFEGVDVPHPGRIAESWDENVFPGEAAASDGQWSIASYGLFSRWGPPELMQKVRDAIISVGDDKATPRRVQGAAAELLAVA